MDSSRFSLKNHGFLFNHSVAQVLLYTGCHCVGEYDESDLLLV